MKQGIKRWMTVLALCVLSALVLFILDRVYPPDLDGKTWSTLVVAKDGTPLRAFADDNGVWRYPSLSDDISALYFQALINYEDRWFYKHPGVNPFALVRALFQNISSQSVVSGGSTLTMQTARLLHPHKKTLAGKFYQILRALQLEFRLSKNQILGLYINTAPFGSNIEGVRTACFTYLGKDAKELSHAEAALLAVLPQAPSYYRPDRHPERARKARDKVLDRMGKTRIWGDEIILAAKQEPVTASRYRPPVIAPLASRRMYKEFPGKNKIVSCLDSDLQIHLEQVVKDYMSGFPKEQSVAVMVVNYKTLEVLAYIGSADINSKSGKGHVDMVKAVRSPGSALKPFLYGLAIDEGLIHSHSLLMDIPRYHQEYDPGNFSKGFSGPVSAAKALRMSLNLPAVQVLEAYGPHKFYDHLVNAGARLRFSGEPNLSMILGGLGTDLESMVRLYTALARDGISGMPRMTDDAPVQERYLMSPGAAWIVIRMLQQPMPGFESINRLAGYMPVAWKTGTSYGFRDAWAFGIMGDYVAGIWIGRPDGSPSPGQYGAVTALPLLQQVFDSVPMSGFRKAKPDNVQKVEICWPLGTQAVHQADGCVSKHDAWILDGKIPVTLTPSGSGVNPLLKTFWVNESGYRAQPSCGGVKRVSVALWPAGLEPWLPGSWRRQSMIPLASRACPNLAAFSWNPVKITSVSNESLMVRLPGQDEFPSIELSAYGGQGNYHWFLNGHPLQKVENGRSVFITMPAPGTYQLTVADASGSNDVVRFEVLAGTELEGNSQE